MELNFLKNDSTVNIVIVTYKMILQQWFENAGEQHFDLASDFHVLVHVDKDLL